MTEHHHNITVKQRGFFIHPQEPWLGASSDGVVIDHCCTPSKGLLEIKWPYSIREITPREACDMVPSFYCSINDGVVKLKREHQYYHQVQLQLFVCSSEYNWCVYTPVDIAIERITLDKEWIEEAIPKLKD